MNFNVFVAKYRNSIFLIHESPLIPSPINLRNYYGDTITVNLSYVSQNTCKSYPLLKDVILTFDISATYIINYKLLNVTFKWNSDYNGDDRLIVDKIEYYTHDYCLLGKEITKNSDTSFTIDNILNIKQPLKFYITYHKHPQLEPRKVVIEVGYISMYILKDNIIGSLVFNVTDTRKSIFTLTRYSRIIYKPAKYEVIEPVSNYNETKSQMSIEEILRYKIPYYIRDTLSDDIQPNPVYNGNEVNVSYTLLNSWSF